MKFKIVTMSPQMASKLLEHNHPNNRGLKQLKIDLMVHDILQGNWVLTHQPIAVDVDGDMIDGQNRCHACVIADKPIEIVFATECPSKSMVAVDLNTARNVVDMARVLGEKVNATIAGMGRAMLRGMETTYRPSHREVLDFIKAHRPAFEFVIGEVCNNKFQKGITMAPVLAVLGRAYYLPKAKHERIKEFMEVLKNGLVTNPQEDMAAIRLRNLLLNAFTSGLRKSRQGAALSQSMVYAKTEKALEYFLKKEPLEKLYQLSKEELFLLPEEKD